MKISRIYQLAKTQAELDFVDIDVAKDLPLFLDPFFLGNRTDQWSADATLTLKSFFQHLIDLIRSGKETDARHMFEHLHEPNATCLGLSKGRPEGNGVGKTDTVKIYDNLLKSKAIQTGLLQDIEDNMLFIEGFGKDKLSDMTTNIIRKDLMLYTQFQCKLHHIPLRKLPSDFYWSRKDNVWTSEFTEMLLVKNRKILLVPKGVVSFNKSYTPDKYYNHFVLNFLQNEHLRMNTALVKKGFDGAKRVTKKDLREKHPQTKEFLREFTLKHPEVLEDFKEKVTIESLKNSEISDVNLLELCKTLGAQLLNIPVGNNDASAYHSKILGILELLFYPDLINPIKEHEIHSGRKRIDISFDNASENGIFYRLSHNMRLPCQFIFVECKNYSLDISNPELDQIAGRFSINRGTVGLLLCRSLKNRQLFIARCIDTYKDQRGLIIPLADQDIINLLDNYNEHNRSFFEQYLTKLVREIALS